MIRALLWDVDGTLAETERDGHRVAFNRAFEAFGLPWRWDEAHYGRLLRVAGGRERLLVDLQQRDAVSDGHRDTLARELHACKNRFYAEIVAQAALPLRPGVAELIDEARRRGLSQAIVTTTSRSNVQALLGRHFGAGWEGHFAAVVCGEDVSAKKPDPEAHRLALATLGLPPLATLAIEDSAAGAAAARAADVPVLVTRSHYFADDVIDGAVAIGGGLHTRAGWQPAPAQAKGTRVTLDDLAGWQARATGVSHVGQDRVTRIG
jgi:HAD superfamily hydrolase (TIGR01509 family)